MKLAIAAFGVATLVGVGYIIGKKIVEKRREEEDDYLDFEDIEDIDGIIDEDEPDVGVYCKESYSDKIRKASMFAVGAIKTGADKLNETIQDIKTKDMVKKGESAMEAVKETGENIKNDLKKDIEDLKSMVSSINDDDINKSSDDLAEDLFEEAPDSIFEPKEEDKGSDIFDK